MDCELLSEERYREIASLCGGKSGCGHARFSHDRPDGGCSMGRCYCPGFAYPATEPPK